MLGFPFRPLVAVGLVLGLVIAASKGPAARAGTGVDEGAAPIETLTDVDIVTLLKALEKGLSPSSKLEDRVSFYQTYLTEDAVLRTKLRMTYPGAPEPVSSTVSYGKSAEIDNLKATNANLQVRRFELKIVKVQTAPGGHAAEAVYRTREESVFTPPGDEPNQQLHASTLATCTASIVAGHPVVMISAISCDAEFNAKY